jgi:hypothetical protein
MPGVVFELEMQHFRSDDATDVQGSTIPGREKVRGTSVRPIHLAWLDVCPLNL